MKAIAKVITVEAKLLYREPGTWIVAVLVPTIILVAIGLLFAPHTPEAAFGGRRFIDLFVPSMVVLTVATLGANTMPARLVKYRERGVLRRLSTTPVAPTALLVAQLLINIVVAVVALLLLIVVGAAAFQIPIPQNPLGFVAAFILGISSLFALGLLIAAIAPTTGVAAAMIVPLFVAVMFLGGVYLPRMFLPDVLQRIGEYTPPGVQALLDAWLGTAAPAVGPLAIMGLITLVAGAAAVRLFRWE
jgi:ABC-2 type transport system permease protein